MKKKKLTPIRIAGGSVFAILLVLTLIFGLESYKYHNIFQLITILEVLFACAFFFPMGKKQALQKKREKQKLQKRTLLSLGITLLCIPLTVLIGTFYLGDRKYYFISLLVIIEALIPFLVSFESKKPKARELIIISVLCALAVAGRSVFYMLPQFKPVIAIIILSAVAFGGETGFLVGAVCGFVSNFFFGQGPWTPWQMIAFGFIGLVAGLLFRKGMLAENRISLSIFGFFATVILYGGIMNPASLILYQPNPTMEMLISTYVMGLPFDLIHACSTALFLWFLTDPMLEKLERVKAKYGLTEQ